MKILCPICNQVGILEQRGNSIRIIHYEYQNEKRIFVKHLVDGNSIMGTMGTVMGTEKANTRSVENSEGGCRLAWSRLVDLGSIDSGSNPGSPIRTPLRLLCQGCLYLELES